MHIVGILILTLIQFDKVLSEFQIFRLNRARASCQIKIDNLTTLKSSGSFIGESTEMCKLGGKESCLFVANHRKRIGNTDYQEHGCGECPIKSSHMCKLIKDKYEEVKTICCCKTPNCLTTIYRDSEIGWKGTDSDSPCIVASYDSIREPRWVENQDARSTDERFFTNTCFLTIRSSSYTDSRNHRNRSRIMVEMGLGCPFQMTSDQPEVSFDHDRTTHCCQGTLCNQKLYRLIGFEWIQNTVLQEEEREFFRRLEFERYSYRFQNFFKNPNYFHPKSIFDLLRTQWVLGSVLAAALIAFFHKPKKLDSLPPIKFRVKKNSKTKEQMYTDEALVFGEL